MLAALGIISTERLAGGNVLLKTRGWHPDHFRADWRGSPIPLDVVYSGTLILTAPILIGAHHGQWRHIEGQLGGSLTTNTFTVASGQRWM